MILLDKIKTSYNEEKVYYTKHALFEMENEEFGAIFDNEIDQAINNSQIIEEYLNDKPYPSILILGFTLKNRPIHIVAAYNSDDNFVIIITTYHPDPELWDDNKRRKEK